MEGWGIDGGFEEGGKGVILWRVTVVLGEQGTVGDDVLDCM